MKNIPYHVMEHEVATLRAELKSEHEKAINLFIDLHKLKHAVKTLIDTKERYNSAMAYEKLVETYEKLSAP